MPRPEFLIPTMPDRRGALRARMSSIGLSAALVATLLAAAGLAQAGSLVGHVSGSGQGLVGASVRVLELARTERTVQGGRFTFADVPSGRYRVVVGLIGYASQTRTIDVAGDTTTANFDLEASAIPLDEVVVSATPFPRTPDEQYQSGESKSLVDLQNSSGSSFAEKLSDVPGVSVRSNGSAPSRPVLRGLSDNRVLVLENGLRTGDLATFDPAHATPLEAVGISQIDVVRGPSSILYGPSALAGLVNVITNIVPTVADRTLSGTVVVEGNSVSDQVAGYSNTVVSSGHHALGISAGGTHYQDIRIPAGTYVDPASATPFDLSRMPQTFDRSWEVGAGYAYQGESGHIGFGGKHYEMNYGIPGVPPNPDWIDVPPSTSRIEQSRNTGELRGLFNSQTSVLDRWKIDASYNGYTHSEFPTAQDSTGVSDPEANHFHQRTFNGSLQIHHRPLGPLQGTVGLWTDIEDLTIAGDQPLGPDSRTSGFAGYAFEEVVVSEKTRFQGGLRYDYNKIQTRPNPTSSDSVFRTLDESRLHNAVTASLGAVQSFNPRMTGSVYLARSFRAPTVQELFADGLDAASGTFTIGSADLGPETGLGIDASFRGSFQHGTLEISPYANFIKDYIYGFLTGDTIQAFPVRQFTATDARLMGFEASATYLLAEHVAVEASGDYVDARDTRNDIPLPFTPPFRGLVRATYQDRRYTGMAEVRMAARQTKLGEGDTPTAASAVVNLGVGLRLPQQGLVHNVALHCDNLLNTVYRDHLSVIKNFLPQPARGVRLNYELQF
jgi:iron complex outermembrane receptor protein